MEWRDLERLPHATPQSWEARRIGGRVIQGKAAIEAAVAKWHLLDPLMVSPPGHGRFLPVLHVEELRWRAHRALIRRHALSIAVLLAAAALLVVSGYVAGRESAVRAGMMALALAAFVAADHHLVVRRIDALAERALFALWVCRAGARHALAWSAALLVVGALQLYAEARLGGHEALLAAYGAVRGLMVAEPWRIVVGPLLHGSLPHWLTNFAMLAVAAAITGPLLGGVRAAAVLLCGSCCGAVASFAFEATSPWDVYVGISAGIFALLGWCAGAALRRPTQFPSGFAVTAASFALLNVALAWIAAPAASNAGHVAGTAFGFLAGVCFPSPSRLRA